MTQVIYARVPEALKDAADAYASERGATLTGAVVDLLDRGLAAVSNERSIAEMQTKLARAKTERAQIEAELQSARTELAALQAFAVRAGRAVGRCPNASCGQEITGYDLLAGGACRQCGQPLSSLIAPATSAPTIDQRELMILVGALGAVLGIALLASK